VQVVQVVQVRCKQNELRTVSDKYEDSQFRRRVLGHKGCCLLVHGRGGVTRQKTGRSELGSNVKCVTEWKSVGLKTV
jgi:hypothetical protein